MSRIIRVYLDDETERRMEHIASELGRKIEELAEAAVADAAIEYLKSTGGLALPPAKLGSGAQ